MKPMKRKSILPYEPHLKEKARSLRKNSTFSEVLLWNHLRNKRLRGFRFLRQKPIDRFIVDFFCPELMLAIEIDGVTHDKKLLDDTLRQERLEKLGVRFLRFLDIDVKTNMEGVISSIEKWIVDHDEDRSKTDG